jgi:flagellar basal-body rod protein FlgF
VRGVFHLVRGLYTSAAGALVAQSNVDVIANNLANVNTGGFKRSLLEITSTLPMQLYRVQTDPGQVAGALTPGVPTMSPVGPLGFGSEVLDSPANYEQGALEQTGNPLDVALQGQGFFTIQTPQGVRYTRNGEFERNAQGLLTTQDGNLVLGRNGAITLPTTGTVAIDKSGAVSVNGQQTDQLQLTQFANPLQLRPEGGNRFVDSGAEPSPDTQSTVSQGMLEKSNADVVRSMVDLITNERWFDANEKSISTQDTANQQLIEQVGRTA